MKDQRKTWFIDFDGTLVYQKSHLSEEDQILPSTLEFFQRIVKEEDCVVVTTARSENDHKERIRSFMDSNNLKCDFILCGVTSGIRILINDKKPDGSTTAYSLNTVRDQGINIEEIWDIYDNKI